jgi:hypothetical protein
MRYLAIYTPKQNQLPTPQKHAEMSKFVEESAKAGVYLDGGALHPPAFRVRSEGAKVSVTDGPFPETKELIVGYAMLQAKSKEEALEQTKRFLQVAGDGEVEIRFLVDAPPVG